MENNENPDAKFHRIANEIVANKDWRKLLAGEYADELRALAEIVRMGLRLLAEKEKV